ncbi:MAG: Xaa-Pro dipeptidyl-peptidase [Bacteroidetes bacterium]|nr:Xaa-Pro dipeptidyl-peptidase [Bacteroidota bacterium]
MSTLRSAFLATLLLLLFTWSATAQTRPVFEDGMAQVVDAFADESEWIREELWVETEFDSDGNGTMDRVHVAVVRQAQTESEGLKVPVIYGSSPYYSGTAGLAEIFWDVKQEVGDPPPPKPKYGGFEGTTRPGISNGYVADWLPRGFAVVHSESPGTGMSQGCPTVGGINESLAPKAVIDWLNGRAKGYTQPVGGEEVAAEWSTGNVGMHGTSYNGTLPLAAATTGVDGLKAIIPVAPNTSYWHYYRSYGLVRHPGGYLGEDIDVLYDFIHSQKTDRRDYCNDTVRDGEMAEGRDRTTGDYNDFWAGRDYLNVTDKIEAAVLMAHAFNDWNVMPEHSVRIVEALKGQVPVQMYYHQGGHGGPPPLDMMNKWFTRYLYDVENGVENDPKAWIVREGDERLEPTPYADYPNPESESVRLYPTLGGQYTAELSLDVPVEQGVESLEDNVSFSGKTLAQAEYTNHRLLYVTPELTEDVHLSGTATMKVRLAANKPAVNFSVWLVSLPWTEGRRPQGGLITRGWFDPQNHSSMTDGEPLIPGEFVEFEFDLQPDDQVIAAGQKIGLMIMSSDRDFTLWPAPGSQLQVDLNATSIELPIVGGREALESRLGTW